MHDNGSQTLSVPLENGDMLTEKSLVLAAEYSVAEINQLRSYVLLMFHGFGLGSTRGTEVEGLLSNSCWWSHNTLYYWTYNIKEFCYKRSDKGLTKHKLPPSLAQIVLIFRSLSQSTGLDMKWAIPERRTASLHKMNQAVAEIFNLGSNPNLTQIRHLWTSICNVTIPSYAPLSMKITADKHAAEASGHSEKTHSKENSTEMVGAEEMAFDKYHMALGYNKSPASSEITKLDLKDALVERFGSGADYKSYEQRDMVEVASIQPDKHDHAGLPCGG